MFQGKRGRLVGQQLALEDELEAFWRGHRRLGPLQRFMAALERVVLSALNPGPFSLSEKESLSRRGESLTHPSSDFA